MRGRVKVKERERKRVRVVESEEEREGRKICSAGGLPEEKIFPLEFG